MAARTLGSLRSVSVAYPPEHRRLYEPYGDVTRDAVAALVDGLRAQGMPDDLSGALTWLSDRHKVTENNG